MRYIATMLDSMLNLNYDLYEINAKVLRKMINDTYNLSDVRLQTFNCDIDLFSNLSDLKAKNDGMQRIYNGSDLERLRTEIKSDISKIISGEYSDNRNDILGEMGYELMPIAVSVANKDIAKAGCKVDLLDGFRRMFYVSNVPNRNILVKVYDTLNDSEWINSMIVFNSWKFANHDFSDFWARTCFSKLFIDRGFRLGLYYRYGINFLNLNCHTHLNVFELIDIYVKKCPYESLWNNNQFYKDVLTMNQIENYEPIFFYVEGKRVKKELKFDCTEIRFKSHSFMTDIIKMYVFYLGEIRRTESSKEKQGEIVERKPFTFDTYKKFLSREDLQPHFIKLSTMNVPGFIENYINSNLKNEIKMHILKEHCDIDWTPVVKENKVHNIEITGLML